MARSIIFILTLAGIGIAGGGCGGGVEQESTSEIETLPIPTAAANEQAITIDELREALGIGDEGAFRKIGGQIRLASLAGTDVTDLSPLAGLPLKQLDISDTQVSDLSPLAGMPLEVLYAERTRVNDISPLTGLPL
jgi:internalin A